MSSNSRRKVRLASVSPILCSRMNSSTSQAPRRRKNSTSGPAIDCHTSPIPRRAVLWDAQAGGAMEIPRAHGVEDSELFLKSPVRLILEGGPPLRRRLARADRSEEHTSELQSLMRISYAVFCLKK